ncbi:MAG: S1C family serine protease [bacterium]
MNKIIGFTLFIILVGAGCKKSGEERTTPGQDFTANTITHTAFQEQQYVDDQISNSRHNAITRAVEKVSDAVCGINVTQIREYYRSPVYDDPFFRLLFPNRVPRQAVKSLGSGFLISKDGYILTNEHVVHNAVEIVVVLSDGSTHNADLVGTDYITDIALIKIDGNNHPVIEFGDSDDVIIGEWVIALGNPFGLFEINAKPTVTVGVVSALDRDFGKQKNNRVYQDMIQTDAAINQGNSGGPLVNSLGQVIGLNTFIFTSSDYNSGSIGLGFAIPINRIKGVLNELKEFGEVNRRFWSGLEVDDITPLMARYFRLKSSEGVIVTNVNKNSPADKAGLEVGDIIVEMNNEKIRSRSDIWRVIEDSDLRGGDQLNLVVIRDRKRLSMTLRLEEIAD